MADNSGGRRVSEGLPEPLGVTIRGTAINVAVFSAHAERIDFCLFDETGNRELERIPLSGRTGDIHHALIEGIGLGSRYGLRASGPYAPHEGHRFNPAKLLLDPYALAIDRRFQLDPALFGFEQGTGRPQPDDSAALMPKAVVAAPVLAEPWYHAVPWERMVIAELHVRGFTKLHPGVPEEIRGTFAGLASPAAIAHLQKLGITTVELMPAMAGIDERHLKPLGLTNYWNYNPIAWMVPDPKLAPGGWDEVRAATAALNAAGIEVLLDVVYNHSGESDAQGPTVSMRGLDNAAYYRLDPNDPARYVDDAGCGNILACDRPWVVRLVLDSLRAWAQYGGINGFRFDLATTLGRRASGFEAGAPLLSAIEQDPILRTLRLIAEPWDIGPGGYQVGAFDAPWGEWNDRYRDDVRRFWRGDGSIADLATRLSGSTDKFWSKRRPSRSVNYITAHDGFSLADLVAYVHKHNDANGEQNRDGTNDNMSWNYGVEGPTDDPAIAERRRRDQRNLLATLFLSRGTPMFGPGAETGATQNGNNNAYAQDNAISWIDWSATDGELPGFVASLAALRAANPALAHDRFLTGTEAEGTGLPDVVWRLPNGDAPSASAWHDAASMTLVSVLSAPDPHNPASPNRTTAIFHAGWMPERVVLPEARDRHVWRVALDTGAPMGGEPRLLPGEADIDVPARTVMLLVEQAGDAPEGRRHIAPDLLDRLAKAAGIAPEWFEVGGQRHEVAPDTKRALLAAMGLSVGSTGEARDRLDELSALRERRTLPMTATSRAEHPVRLRLASDGGSAPSALVVEREDGSRETITLDPGLPRRMATAPDGRPVEIVDLALPPQPVGRHRLLVDSRPEMDCRLTVAPERCFMPPDLAAGGRAFGIAAHLYTMRGADDGGIGDFSTLGHFAEASAKAGAALVGVNPLHMLFPSNRDRASPYHPSDRRFLDPIYLDVADPIILGQGADVGMLFTAEAGTFAALRDHPLVDYPNVWLAKKAVLDAAFVGFDKRAALQPQDADIREFKAFVDRGGETLQRFAVFQAIAETITDRDWMGWPTRLQDSASGDVAAFAQAYAPRVRYHLYLQWLCDRQLSAASARARAAGQSIGLYLDLAVGTAPDGAEHWAEQAAYARGVSVGSPPDPFSATGQIWCLPPPNPIARDRSGESLLGSLLAANMQHAGAIRIDHAMGLSRLFWVPDGAPGSAGAYVGYDFEANLADVALESARGQCLVVGEDLGTVQEGFREALERNDILSYRVVFFERDGHRFKPADTYPRKAVACVATHDIAPLAGWWAGADIAEREAIGQLDHATAEHSVRERDDDRRALASAVGEPGLVAPGVPASDITRAVHGFVAETPSMLVVLQADDLLGLEDAVNLPGTDKERPNWRRRLPVDADTLFEKAARQGTIPKLP